MARHREWGIHPSLCTFWFSFVISTGLGNVCRYHCTCWYSEIWNEDFNVLSEPVKFSSQDYKYMYACAFWFSHPFRKKKSPQHSMYKALSHTRLCTLDISAWAGWDTFDFARFYFSLELFLKSLPKLEMAGKFPLIQGRIYDSEWPPDYIKTNGMIKTSLPNPE